eukprot:231137_1
MRATNTFFFASHYPGYFVYISILLTLFITVCASTTCNDDAAVHSVECNPVICGGVAALDGDPHWTTFNGVREHFQGDVNAPNQEFYLLTSCDGNKLVQPFSMIGSMYAYNNGAVVTNLNYVSLLLYTGDETDYAWISTGSDIIKYALQSDQTAGTTISPNYQTSVANGVIMQDLNTITSIGQFKIFLIGKGSNDVRVRLLVNTEDQCDVNFRMIAQGVYSTHRMHEMTVQPPPCYRCSNCGLFGDFQTPTDDNSLLMCNGQRFSYRTSWWPPSEAFDGAGWSWQYPPPSPQCSVMKTAMINNWGAAHAPQIEHAHPPNPTVCTGDLQAQIVTTCQRARDQQIVCCRNIGGGYCTNLQESCEIDVCVGFKANVGSIDELVEDVFTVVVEDECNEKGLMGAVPKLLYDFQDSFAKKMSQDSKYELQAQGDAEIVNGVLQCDGQGDFVYSKENFDFEVESHSLEVLVTISEIEQHEGGAISIDSNYTVDGEYHHDEYNAIVYNEYGDKEWSLGYGIGSHYETVTNQFIHLIATYDVKLEEVKLYRNGILDQDTDANSIFTADDNEGVRMMFCRSYFNSIAQDFFGTIRYGAYYDQVLILEQVERLYSTQIVTINTIQFEVIGDELTSGGTLTGGQALRSLNERYVAAMQYDGNFVVYNTDTDVIVWATGTETTGDESFITLQNKNGNLIIYNGISRKKKRKKKRKEWSSHGYSDTSSFLILQDDGNLVAYQEDDTAYWDSKGTITKEKSIFFKRDTIANNSNRFLFYICGIVIICLTISCVLMYCIYNSNKYGKYSMVSIKER